RLAGGHPRTDLDERRGARFGRAIGGADHRRGDRGGMPDELLWPRRGCPRAGRRTGGLSGLRLAPIGGKRGREIDAARDPDPLALELYLDLGEAGLLEKRREFANEVLVEGSLFLGHRRRPPPSAISLA